MRLVIYIPLLTSLKTKKSKIKKNISISKRKYKTAKLLINLNKNIEPISHTKHDYNIINTEIKIVYTNFINIIKMPNIINIFKRYIELLTPDEQLHESNRLIKEVNKSI